MPYVKNENRHRRGAAANAGELNYRLTCEIIAFLGLNQPVKYEHLNAAIGALEACKLELYRRLVVPYEDVKIEQNGDVY